jgi:FKBP-type peptidyl-prolyl cis-trans isomerase FkpA
MKTTFYCLLILTGLLAISCDKKTPGGVKYQILKKGDGKPVAFGQYLVMNLQLKDANDSLWYDSKANSSPVVIPVPDASMEKDDTEFGVFKILTKGDSTTFQLSAQKFLVRFRTRNQPIPKGIDSTSMLTFNVGLQDVWNDEQMQAFQKKMNEEQQKKMEEQQAAQIKIDSAMISSYLLEKGIAAQTTSSGLRYVVKQKGLGRMARSGQTASVHYAGRLLNGKLFDTSLASVAQENNFPYQGNNAPYPVVVNTQSVIPGWDEMLQLMNKGMKVTVYVPSHLAYGPRGGGEIPPFSILVFDMEVTDIK